LLKYNLFIIRNSPIEVEQLLRHKVPYWKDNRKPRYLWWYHEGLCWLDHHHFQWYFYILIYIEVLSRFISHKHMGMFQEEKRFGTMQVHIWALLLSSGIYSLEDYSMFLSYIDTRFSKIYRGKVYRLDQSIIFLKFQNSLSIFLHILLSIMIT